MKTRIIKQNILYYFLFIPFLYPRGFQSFFEAYKTFFTAWLYIAICMICALFINRGRQRTIKIQNCILFMLVYSLLFILITLVNQGGINDGLQKLFVVPTICLFCAMFIQDKPRRFINVTSNILIINFIINVTVMNPCFWPVYFNEDTHINFIGHVQTSSQCGVLGIIIAYALYRYHQKNKARLLIFLAGITMIVSEAAAAYLCVILFLVFYLLFVKMKKTRIYIEKNIFTPLRMLLLYIIVNAVIFTLLYYSDDNGYTFLTNITNGRTFVWEGAFDLIKNKFWFGYGAYGAKIKVFWSSLTSDSEGMNYAHNEILQQMLNGGITLTATFLLTIYQYCKNISIEKNGILDYWPYVCLFIMLILMLFESVTEYYYFFILLSIIGYWKDMDFKN